MISNTLLMASYKLYVLKRHHTKVEGITGDFEYQGFECQFETRVRARVRARVEVGGVMIRIRVIIRVIIRVRA